MLSGSVFLLLFTGVAGSYSDFSEYQNESETFPSSSEELPESEEKCSYFDVLEHLKLTSNANLFKMTRPVKHHKDTTTVFLNMAIYAILDVREIDQILVSYVWIFNQWNNVYITWTPEDFCGIYDLTIPNELLWKPDLTIEEMIEKDKAPPSPLLKIYHDQRVEYRNDQVIISTCEMHVYKFPFDVQSCNISFKSIFHSDQEMVIVVNDNNTLITMWSREIMQTQYEWLFIDMSVDSKTTDFYGYNQTSIVYTITMKRRSILYVANFLLPILLLVALDLASFLIPNSGGEKLGFKVTVLLAVTVMQLILNDILPSSADNVPLIVVYCIGIFSMMLLSLFETILAIYLMEKDSSSRHCDTDTDQRVIKQQHDDKTRHAFAIGFGNVKKRSDSTYVFDQAADYNPSLVKEDSNGEVMDLTLAMERFTDELEGIRRIMVQLSGEKPDLNSGHWTRLSNRIDKIFFFVYVGTIFVFLIVIFSVWM